MACVTYKPSKILFNNELFTRNDLIDKIEIILNENIKNLGLDKKYQVLQLNLPNFEDSGVSTFLPSSNRKESALNKLRMMQSRNICSRSVSVDIDNYSSYIETE